MTVSKAISIVTGVAFFSTAVGGAVGFALGTYAPDFITALFPRLLEGSSATQIGTGLGVVNGGLAGIAVGALVMGTLTWYELRLKQLNK